MRDTVNLQSISPRRAAALGRELVDWYRENARQLPWRRSSDAYEIWVSEVMLQQTRVEAVLGRYERFLSRFPTLEALAAAQLNEVLAEWAGLGYYRRARSLHAAARVLVEGGSSELPPEPEALRLLPGFGEYTAGAVASIAFGQSVTAVDGNVERVIARLLAMEEMASKGVGAREVRSWARAMLEGQQPGELNQALMELGALVCTPKSPSCGACPWKNRCRAVAIGRQTDYPRRPERRAAEDVLVSVAAVRDDAGRLLFRRRAEGGRNAGLWELPSTEFRSTVGESPPRGANELAELGRQLGRQWQVGEPLARVKHAITHHRVTATLYQVRDSAPMDEGDGIRLETPEDAPSLGLTAATTKLLAKLPKLL